MLTERRYPINPINAQVNNKNTNLEQKFRDMVTNRSIQNNTPWLNSIIEHDVVGFDSEKKKVVPVVIAPSNTKNISGFAICSSLFQSNNFWETLIFVEAT